MRGMTPLGPVILAKQLEPVKEKQISETTSAWLEEHITNPDSPPLDTSLTVANAAADAKVVGDIFAAAVVGRGTLSAGTDMDTVYQPGEYYKSQNVELTHQPDGQTAYQARILVFSANTGYAVAQIWFNVQANSIFVRTKRSPAIAFTAWKKLATKDDVDAAQTAVQGAIDNLEAKSLVNRGNLTSSVDMDDVTTIGSYLKNRNVTVANGVNSARARVIVFGSESGYAVEQIWFDVDNNRIYERNLSSSGLGWNGWMPLSPISSLELTLSEASLPPSTGKWASSDSNFGRSVATVKRLNVSGAYKIIVKWQPKNKKTVNDAEVFCDRLSIFEYAADGTLVKATTIDSGDVESAPVTSELKLSSGTTTVAFSIYNNGGPAAIPCGDIELTAYGTSNITEVFNPSFGSNVTGTRWYRFGYKVGEYVDSNGALAPVYNTGMMMLPPNYSASGKPVPVVISVHGSQAYLTKDGTQIADYEPYYNYLNDCGYALIDCYGWTLRYPDASGEYNPYIMPTTCAAYTSLLQLMLKSFNLDADNVFVLCKSLGGHMAAWISAELPVRATAMLAPALNLNLGYTTKARTAIGSDLGLVGIADTSVDESWTTPEACYADFLSNYRTSWTAAQKQAFYQANEEKLVAWNAETKRVIGSTAAGLLEMAAKTQWSTSERALGRIGFAPIKIWCAQDDAAVNYNLCVTFSQQLRNAGFDGILRTMPNDTGGHHSVDTDENAPQQTNITTPLGYEYETVPLAYYEAWQWFEAHRRG